MAVSISSSVVDWDKCGFRYVQKYDTALYTHEWDDVANYPRYYCASGAVPESAKDGTSYIPESWWNFEKSPAIATCDGTSVKLSGCKAFDSGNLPIPLYALGIAAGIGLLACFAGSCMIITMHAAGKNLPDMVLGSCGKGLRAVLCSCCCLFLVGAVINYQVNSTPNGNKLFLR